jgi:hypothetical protein
MKEEKITIKEKVTFTFGYYENAINVATALAMSGYYIKLRKDSNSSYVLIVFTDRT